MSMAVVRVVGLAALCGALLVACGAPEPTATPPAPAPSSAPPRATPGPKLGGTGQPGGPPASSGPGAAAPTGGQVPGAAGAAGATIPGGAPGAAGAAGATAPGGAADAAVPGGAAGAAAPGGAAGAAAPGGAAGATTPGGVAGAAGAAGATAPGGAAAPGGAPAAAGTAGAPGAGPGVAAPDGSFSVDASELPGGVVDVGPPQRPIGGAPAPPGGVVRRPSAPPRPRPPEEPGIAIVPPIAVAAGPLGGLTAAELARYAPPTVRNGDRKWGIGVYKDSNRVADLLLETRPGVILLMDPSVGWAQRVRKQHPDAFIVGRRFRTEVDQPLDRPDERGAAFATWVAELAVPLRGTVDAWMGYNEAIGNPPRSLDYAAYNRFQVAFARKLQYGYGIAAVAANDAPGALQPDDYPRYFADAIQVSEFFGVHAYALPSGSMEKDAEWHALRYRKIHEALERAGIRGKRMVITESGVGNGFRSARLTDEQMADGFVWLTRELRRDPYMIGQAVFGVFDETGAWPDYDITNTGVVDGVPRLLDRLP
jgi:hypothetical protein